MDGSLQTRSDPKAAEGAPRGQGKRPQTRQHGTSEDKQWWGDKQQHQMLQHVRREELIVQRIEWRNQRRE